MADDSEETVDSEVLVPAVRRDEDLEGALEASDGLTSRIPGIVERARAAGSYVDYFLARFENEHTRRAYKRQIDGFLDWCDARGLELAKIMPRDCALFRDQRADVGR